MTGYHVTTPAKLRRYKSTGAILPPVRFWPSLSTARLWAKHTGRQIILKIECEKSHPLPDHRPAHWTPNTIRAWEEVTHDQP